MISLPPIEYANVAGTITRKRNKSAHTKSAIPRPLGGCLPAFRNAGAGNSQVYRPPQTITRPAVAARRRNRRTLLRRGNGLVALERLGFTHIEGVDLSPRLLEQYKGPAKCTVADCRKLPFPDLSKDVLIVQAASTISPPCLTISSKLFPKCSAYCVDTATSFLSSRG